MAERRRIETHPRTGAVQVVEVRERVEEIAIQPALARQPGQPFAVPAETSLPAMPLFSKLSPDDALSIGVPEGWIKDVLDASEDKFFALAGHLPQEAAEALLDYAATGVLKKLAAITVDPYSHPDA